MKESVKLETDLVKSVKKHIKTTGQTIGGFFEIAAKSELAGGLLGKIKEDPDLFRGWKDNIAMSIKDEFAKHRQLNGKHTSFEDMHRIANNGAENFLKLLIR
jgi:hypothetical protein